MGGGAWLNAGLWMQSEAGEGESQNDQTCLINIGCFFQWWLRADTGKERAEEAVELSFSVNKLLCVLCVFVWIKVVKSFEFIKASVDTKTHLSASFSVPPHPGGCTIYFGVAMFYFLHMTFSFQISHTVETQCDVYLEEDNFMFSMRWSKEVESNLLATAISVMLVCQEKPSHTNPFTLSRQTGPENSTALTHKPLNPKHRCHHSFISMALKVNNVTVVWA